MRVRVIQMSPVRRQGREHRAGGPADRGGGAPQTGPISSACPKSGPASAATAFGSSRKPRRCREHGGTRRTRLRIPACDGAQPAALTCMADRSSSAKVTGCSTPGGVRPGGARDRPLSEDPFVRHRRARTGQGYRESATFGGGDEVVTYDRGKIRIGCAICYDVRFRNCFSRFAAQERS